MNKDSLQHHIEHLEKQHRDLDKQILEDYKHYGDDRLVGVLKKQKLRLKDEIQNFKRQLENI